MNLNEKQNNYLNQLSNCIRILSADAIEIAKSGHPGLPLGFADVMTCLAFNFLRFNPNDPKWFDRDRLVLSAGHGSMLLYSFFFLTGYKGFSLNDIKNFRQFGSKTPGHPEVCIFEGVETTTGPLGQGLATAVGMAIASKKYSTKLGKKICNHKIYTIVGDGCLMEGISYESLSIAGHLNLNNLIVLFDDNDISIDGKTNITISEDHLKKLESFGFNAARVNGHDFEEIYQALKNAQESNKPSFIAFKTKIAKGAKNKEGTEKAHGAPLGAEEIEYIKNNAGFEKTNFHIPQELIDAWRKAWKYNEQIYDEWQRSFNSLTNQQKQYLEKPNISLPDNIDVTDGATRISSAKIVEALMNTSDKIISGSADLSVSNGLWNANCKAITAKDFSGNFIHYGARENAMAAIMNGLALSSFLPISGTFLVFSDYMRPSIRLAAIMKLPVIFIMTHDSIGVGEDGPTHQPIEHLASFRAMPNINVFRPADFIETRECYEIALNNSTKPSMIVLSRQTVPQIRKNSFKNLSAYGGYVISHEKNTDAIDLTIFSTGSEVSIAIDVQNKLEAEGLSVRVCSVPCFSILVQQSEYLEELKGNARKLVAIEAACSFGWSKIINSNGLFFGIDSFGASAPSQILYKEFGLCIEKIVEHIKNSL